MQLPWLPFQYNDIPDNRDFEKLMQVVAHQFVIISPIYNSCRNL